MFKKRITACLVIKNGMVVQSIGFTKYLPVGSAKICAEFLNAWGIDEIVILDIDAAKENRGPNTGFVKEISQKVFVPLTVGGGIKTVDDIRQLIQHGADKVSINSAAIKSPKLITQASKIFGAQCLVVSLDVKKTNNKYEVFGDSGKTATGLQAVEFAKKVEGLGAGEILLNAIDQDGLKMGYDVELIKQVSSSVKIPVIALGGAGKPSDFLGALEHGASAAAAGNFFHFTEHSPIIVKSYLRAKGMSVRIDTPATYENFAFDLQKERVQKQPDEYLERSRFEYIPEEII